MKYERFEGLPAWQKAVELAQKAYALARSPAFRPHSGLRDQLERAALSVSNCAGSPIHPLLLCEVATLRYEARAQ